MAEGAVYPSPDERPEALLSTAAPPAVRAHPAGDAAPRTDDRSDDDLAGRIAAGDARAFERLYGLHRAEISRYCATMVRNPHDAEEALQLTMLAAYRALSAGRGPRGSLRPWLFRIAHNECVDILRGRPRVEELTDRHPVAGRLHERVEAREALRQLNDDIAALPLRQRAAFVLHEIDGLPHAAVGEALGTSELGARRLLHEARTTLEEFHAGRALACEDVRVRIGAGDRRILRGRGISAHLRGCASCRDARAAVQSARGGRRRLLVAAATAAIAAGMVALGVRSLAAAPAAADPPQVPVAARPAPLAAPSLATAPAVPVTPPAPQPAPSPGAKAPGAARADAAEPPPAPPPAPDPEVVTVQAAPAPPQAAPVAPPAASDPVVSVDPATGGPSALAAAPPEEAPPPPNRKPPRPGTGQPPAPPSAPAPAPAPEPPGEVAPPEATPAPTPGAPELAPAPPASDAPAAPAEAPAEGPAGVSP